MLTIQQIVEMLGHIPGNTMSMTEHLRLFKARPTVDGVHIVSRRLCADHADEEEARMDGCGATVFEVESDREVIPIILGEGDPTIVYGDSSIALLDLAPT